MINLLMYYNNKLLLMPENERVDKNFDKLFAIGLTIKPQPGYFISTDFVSFAN